MKNERGAKTKWFATGFTGGGLSQIDAGKGQLRGMVACRQGEALGHGVFLDATFIQQVSDAIAALGDKGLKARFGHPNMCSDALGTFIGRWKNAAVCSVKKPAAYRQGPEEPSDRVECRADLFLSTTCKDTPSGDLFQYVCGMAAKEPDMCGASIVFSYDWEAEEQFTEQHKVDETWTNEKGETKTRKVFRSPDPLNTKNLPHARLAAIHAADIVDSPAATEGMFSGQTGAALAAQVTEFLDLHPEVFAALQDENMLKLLVERAADLEPFLQRYAAMKNKQETDHMSETKQEEKPATTPAPVTAEPAKVEALAKAADAAPAPVVEDKPDELAAIRAEVEQLKKDNAAKDEALKASEAKVAALLKGEKPVSVPAMSAAGGDAKPKARTIWS